MAGSNTVTAGQSPSVSQAGSVAHGAASQRCPVNGCDYPAGTACTMTGCPGLSNQGVSQRPAGAASSTRAVPEPVHENPRPLSGDSLRLARQPRPGAKTPGPFSLFWEADSRPCAEYWFASVADANRHDGVSGSADLSFFHTCDNSL